MADYKQVLRSAEQRGWQVIRRRGGHLKLQHTNGAIYFTGGTPSDRRAALNLDRALRRLERGVPAGAH